MSPEEAAREAVLEEFAHRESDDSMDKLADEIVRLRAELKRLREARKGYIDLDALREGGVV